MADLRADTDALADTDVHLGQMRVQRSQAVTVSDRDEEAEASRVPAGIGDATSRRCQHGGAHSLGEVDSGVETRIAGAEEP